MDDKITDLIGEKITIQYRNTDLSVEFTGRVTNMHIGEGLTLRLVPVEPDMWKRSEEEGS